MPDSNGNRIGRHQMHVEVFTPDSTMVDYLLNNPLGLTGGRSYLRLVKGTVIMLASGNGIESRYALPGNASGTEK